MENKDSIRACAEARSLVQSYMRLRLLVISQTSSYNWRTQLSANLLLFKKHKSTGCCKKLYSFQPSSQKEN